MNSCEGNRDQKNYCKSPDYITSIPNANYRQPTSHIIAMFPLADPSDTLRHVPPHIEALMIT